MHHPPAAFLVFFSQEANPREKKLAPASVLRGLVKSGIVERSP
jgi:hypothetical protein